MSNFKLPTTAGSIVTYDGWEDTKHTVKCRYIITLVPSAVDAETGELVGLVWTTAYGEDGGVHDISEEEILAGNPEIVFEASAPVNLPIEEFDPEEARAYGAVVLLNDPMGWVTEPLVVTFTPGLVTEDGEIAEADWVDPHGTIVRQDELNVHAIKLVVKGLDEQ